MNGISPFLSLTQRSLFEQCLFKQLEKKDIGTQLKYYSNLLDRLGESHHLLKKKCYIYEVLFLSDSGNNEQELH